VLLVTVLASAMGFLDTTVVNVAAVRIGQELGADVAGLHWTLNGYLVALASLSGASALDCVRVGRAVRAPLGDGHLCSG
jgi:hypothetical protein